MLSLSWQASHWKKLKLGIAAKQYIRSMPNMAAVIIASQPLHCVVMFHLKKQLLKCSVIGQCFWVESEKEFDIASALAGCSPAWMALVAEALSDGAVKLGLKRELSYHYIATLFEGMGAVLKVNILLS